jgi:hypothetical protein
MMMTSEEPSAEIPAEIPVEIPVEIPMESVRWDSHRAGRATMVITTAIIRRR